MPAKSKAQQRFMGMVYAAKKGKLKKPSPAVKKAVKSITTQQAKDFASTKRRGLPKRKNKKRYRSVGGSLSFLE